MHFCGFETLSAPVRAQLARVADIWQSRLAGDLLGVYLHGSLALGRFAGPVSDLDLLIVTGRRMPRGERLSVAAAVLEDDRKPCPLEMSALYIGDLRPWRHPAVCQFHYSGMWSDTYRRLLDGRLKDCFLLDTDFPDDDIACHVRLTRERGVCVFGRPPAELLPAVPEADFWQSIRSGVETFDLCAYAPHCLPSNLLTRVRVLSYKVEKTILSKYDAGLWALEWLPDRFRPLLRAALRAWYDGEAMPDCPPDELEALRRYLIDRIVDGEPE